MLMKQFLLGNIVAIIFGITTVIFSYLSLIYKKREHEAKISGLIRFKKILSVYLSREALLKGLREIYDNASKGDEIWGQCIGCHRYSDDVREKILEKASEGVSFRILVNSKAPTINEFKELFEPIKTATVISASDNEIRLHGLSNSEVVVTFSTMTGMVAIHIRENIFVSIIKSYFDQRWQKYSPN